ncbi:response regulator [bacterium]|nr:response regulator [bacterium]
MYKVLIVDDVEGLRKHATALIKSIDADASIFEATTGQEGLEKFKTLKPDMVVMDIVMPEMNGIKAAQEIWEAVPNQKILFWSQFHSETYVREIGKIVPDDAIHGYALKTETDDVLKGAFGSVLVKDIPYIDPVVRNVQKRLQCPIKGLNDNEFDILVDLALGLTDRAIALREHISVRGAQNRITSLSNKLLNGLDDHVKESAGWEAMNSRVRIVYEAFRRGILVPEDCDSHNEELMRWLGREFDFDA